MIRVLIADDHPVVRAGLEKILSKEPDFALVGSSENGRGVLTLLRSLVCDVLVLDITLPDMSGLEVLEQLKRERRKVAVLVLSVHKEEMYIIRAFKMGAAGYMTKESASAELVKAIRKIAAGGKYLSPLISENTVLGLNRDYTSRPQHEALSDREFTVMSMIVAGIKPKSIAEELNLSVKTINSYRSRILEKMNIKTNADLVRYAVRNNLLE